MRHAASFVSVALAAVAGSVALTLIGSHVMSKEPRFPQLTTEQLTDAQKPLAEEIMKVSSVGLGGPYNPLLRSPVLGQRMFDLLHYLRWETSVPLKLNEFAILIIQPAVALAGRVVRACAACGQSGAVAGYRRGIEGRQTSVEHAAGGSGGA